jgi:hypothetical protein
MTVNAGNRDMAASKLEVEFLMACQRNRRLVERCLVMALLAAVHIWSTGELPAVNVLVAIQTKGELNLIESRLACGYVALRAGNFSMFLAQRKC